MPLRNVLYVDVIQIVDFYLDSGIDEDVFDWHLAVNLRL